MIDFVFAISESVRYVAVYNNGDLQSRSKVGTAGASSADSDRFEELLVNPTLLTLASQRGNIDCGGLRYLLIRYGNFFQFVMQIPGGHISVCIEANAAVSAIAVQLHQMLS
ncbi:MAG: hypothetical protein M3Y69_11330 [Verrucomicrobiota bacterium]|nr:hypothetical protein [Verrucomicrobiota bacterium]